MSANFKPDPSIGQVLGANWKGTKFLGNGSFGIVTLWEYTGIKSRSPLLSTQVALKHISSWDPAEPTAEIEILDVLDKVNTKHIVKQLRRSEYRRQHDGSYQFGIFLEYCPGGVLHDLMVSRPRAWMRPLLRQPDIAESDLWDLFYCLSLAVSAMARGTENLSSDLKLHGLSNYELAHYDMKTDNVFFGEKIRGRDPEHDGTYAILKLGDFGQALWEPKNSTPAAFAARRRKGAIDWQPPESNRGMEMISPWKGACSNVFQVGLLMHALIHRRVLYPLQQPRSYYIGKLTYGTDLCDAPHKDMFSSTLRDLVLRCMMFEPDDRPSPWELQSEVRRGRGLARKAGPLARRK